MKQFLIVACVIFVSSCGSGARLENTYLPPGSSSAGGTGQFLSAPERSLPGTTFAGFAGSVRDTFSAQKHNDNSFGPYRTRPPVPILKYTNDNFNGQYRFEYETANGIFAREEGRGGEGVRGAYSYTSPEGQQVTVEYVADENGFQPIGSHVHGQEAIRKSLEFNARQEARGIFDDGSYRPEHVPGQYLPPVVIDAKKTADNRYLAPKVDVHRFVPAPKLNNHYLTPKTTATGYRY